MQGAIGFLCTRVSAPLQQDWQKVKRVLMYVKGTIDMPRIISLGEITNMDIYINAAHAVHSNMKGQTGGCVKTDTKKCYMPGHPSRN